MRFQGKNLTFKSGEKSSSREAQLFSADLEEKVLEP